VVSGQGPVDFRVGVAVGAISPFGFLFQGSKSIGFAVLILREERVGMRD
jgi:hypothetical protein